LLVLTQEGPVVLECQENAKSRRDAGATETIASTYWSYREIESMSLKLVELNEPILGNWRGHISKEL